MQFWLYCGVLGIYHFLYKYYLVWTWYNFKFCLRLNYQNGTFHPIYFFFGEVFSNVVFTFGTRRVLEKENEFFHIVGNTERKSRQYSTFCTSWNETQVMESLHIVNAPPEPSNTHSSRTDYTPPFANKTRNRIAWRPPPRQSFTAHLTILVPRLRHAFLIALPAQSIRNFSPKYLL